MPNTSRKVTVIGASGFLGSAVSRYLAEQGHAVTICLRKKLVSSSSDQFARVVTGDRNDSNFLNDAIKDSDAVFDFANSTKPATNFQNSDREYEMSVAPVLKLISKMIELKVPKLIFPSSGGTVYGECKNRCDEDAPLDPQTPYAACKVRCEEAIREAVAANDIAADIFRVANIYGPGQPAAKGTGVIAHWSYAFVRGLPLTVMGDERNLRDYLYIDDLCRLIARSLRDLSDSNTLNLASGESISILQLFELFQKAAETAVDAKFIPPRQSDNSNVDLDCTRLNAWAGKWNKTPMIDGIRNTIQWHRKQLLTD